MTSNCINTIHALKYYSWKSARHETASSIMSKPGDLGKDFADVLRYICMGGIEYVDPTAGVFQTDAFKTFTEGQRLGDSGYESFLQKRWDVGHNHDPLKEDPGPIPDILPVSAGEPDGGD